ncbi:hypothetical protein MRX96_046871 [Rhipicephalus microplus]
MRMRPCGLYKASQLDGNSAFFAAFDCDSRPDGVDTEARRNQHAGNVARVIRDSSRRSEKEKADYDCEV